ncbi:MAG TPA: DUF721 domain-containing protein [Gemmatimonadales bacterium]
MNDSRTIGIDRALDGYLKRRGLKTKLERASVVDDWPGLVGHQIASVTTAEGVTPEGILFVRVASAAWMQELQLMTPEILRKLGHGGKAITRILWRVG